jgi:hypothetical protein
MYLTVSNQSGWTQTAPQTFTNRLLNTRQGLLVPTRTSLVSNLSRSTSPNKDLFGLQPVYKDTDALQTCTQANVYKSQQKTCDGLQPVYKDTNSADSQLTQTRLKHKVTTKDVSDGLQPVYKDTNSADSQLKH